jgi:SAM-dependent methyltransferase
VTENGKRCPACSSTSLKNEGPLPRLTDYAFAGAAKVDFEPGHLFRCRKCTLYFRYPSPSTAQLIAVYAHAPVTEWEYENRREWDTIASWLEEYSPNRRILEVGCFRGDFLHWLGDRWDRVGIEPSQAASEMASGRGIAVIGRSLDELTSARESYGAIIFLDVLEHLTDPLQALRIAQRLLAPSGVIIIFTGTTDAWTWAISGSDYWYCAFPEHLTFINPRWLRWASQRLGLEVSKIVRMSHGNGGRVAKARDIVKLLSYHALKAGSRLGLKQNILARAPVLWRLNDYRSLPFCLNLRDHLLVSLRKS